MSIGTKTSVGCAAPSCERYIMMLIGMIVSPEVFNTRNIIIEFDARSLPPFSSWSSLMAFSPKGVAALSSPSILAERFMNIDPLTGCPFGRSGNSRENTGLSHRASTLTTPPASPTFIIPIHSVSTPVRPIESLNADSAESKVDEMIASNTPASPRNNVLTAATTNAMRKNAIQM